MWEFEEYIKAEYINAHHKNFLLGSKGNWKPQVDILVYLLRWLPEFMEWVDTWLLCQYKG